VVGEAASTWGGKAAEKVQSQAGQPTMWHPRIRTEVARSTAEWQVSQRESSGAAGRTFSSLFDASVRVMTMPRLHSTPRTTAAAQ